MKFRFTHIFRFHFYFPIIVALIFIGTPHISFAQENQEDTSYVDTTYGDSEFLEDVPVEESIHQNIIDTSQQIATLRSVPDTSVNRYKDDKNFAYANDSAYWKKERAEDNDGFLRALGSFANSGLARALFYMVIVGLLLFIFYQVIVVNRLYIFSASKRGSKADEDLHEESSLSKEQLEERLSAAVANSDYRLAVRYLYLITLFKLTQKELVTINANTTNHELIDQLAGRKEAKDFRQLAQIYDYVWYGEFRLSENQYSKVNQAYRDFQNSLKV